MWHVSSLSGVATLRTAIHLLLVTYLARIAAASRPRWVLLVECGGTKTGSVHWLVARGRIAAAPKRIKFRLLTAGRSGHVQVLPPKVLLPVGDTCPRLTDANLFHRSLSFSSSWLTPLTPRTVCCRYFWACPFCFYYFIFPLLSFWFRAVD